MAQKDKTVVSIDSSVYRSLQELALLVSDDIGERVTVPRLIRILVEKELQLRNSD